MTTTADTIDRGWMPDRPSSDLALRETVVRAKLERDLLEIELQDLYQQACTVRLDEDLARLHREIRELRAAVRRFLSEWSAHVSWERSELFPCAAWYLAGEPDLFAPMEEDYRRAERFVREFLAAADVAPAPVSREEAKRLATRLLQAYACLKNRLREEADIVSAIESRSSLSPHSGSDIFHPNK
ncbi:hemerythrin domain-containing protein [Cohnella sp. REN36]|uniref:hemerythrin domain-containing protein n=1 Tax=Cohnella sp. REN36 TaxID=2887347 RepID=UPI001D15497C|nr:hemerythrin domain-containing protein [Cohnella sp. REN36]MCC3375956.1 hypothetical protein [Cohnella sp. REN36]